MISTLFLTLAIALIWRAEDRRESSWRFHLASGAAIGLAILAKGPPAAFALLFLVGFALIRRDAKMIWRWTRSGAPLAAIFIGAPWFAYVIHEVGYETFRRELAALRGAEHQARRSGTFRSCCAPRFRGPGCRRGDHAAAMSWKRDERARVLLVWCTAILLPLLVAGQRQYH